MRRRLVSLQLHLQRDDWRLLPRGLSSLDPLPLAPLPLLYAVGRSPGSVDSDQDSWVVSGPAILAAQQPLSRWEHMRGEKNSDLGTRSSVWREQLGLVGEGGIDLNWSNSVMKDER